MTKILNFALKIKGGGRKGGACEVLRHSHPQKKKNLKRAPIRTGLFADLKRLWGPKWPPPNLTVSGQMTMKLGKDILWVEIFAN